MFAVGREGEGHDPVGMLFEAVEFLAGGDFKEADGVVRAASEEALAIRAEGEREEEIVGGGESAEGRAGVWVDKFDFAGASGIAAAEGEKPAIVSVGEGLNLLRSAGDAAEQGAVGGVPDRDFVITAGGELRAVRMKYERENGHGAGVARGCIRVTGRCAESGEKCLRSEPSKCAPCVIQRAMS